MSALYSKSPPTGLVIVTWYVPSALQETSKVGFSGIGLYVKVTVFVSDILSLGGGKVTV